MCSTSARQLLRDKELTIGRYDGRLTGPSALNTGETSEFDPSSTLITPPFTAMFTTYIRDELGYKTDMYYYHLGRHSAMGLRCAERLRRYHQPCCATPW